MQAITSEGKSSYLDKEPKRARLGEPDNYSKPCPGSHVCEAIANAQYWRLLHSYQKDAVDFLIGRLLDTDFYSKRKSNLCITTGAILADDMGTGKTLVALVTLSSLCKHLSCKGAVVCPASLVNNWQQELNKFFPHSLARQAIVLNGKTTKILDESVRRFVTSHFSLHPIIILSYDMFRTYSTALNTISNFELLVCDEGHKLKNAFGTKTTMCLNNSIAMRRVILTGTPVQNVLDELYAMVNFVIPNFLGSLSEFNLRFAKLIERGEAEDAGKEEKTIADNARLQLQEILAPIVLRRTRESVMRELLPPKHVYYMLIPMNQTQRDAYDLLVRSSISAFAVENFKVESVFPQLMAARLFSSGTTELSSIDGNESAQSQSSSTDSLAMEDIIASSPKLHALFLLLSEIRETTNEKVVVVSNFNTTLDIVKRIAKLRQWGSLRIDGSVSLEARSKIVNFFNRPPSSSEKDPFFLLLLSSKAGGVGLNLVGASRLVLVDCDWNPATDAQAMARIWRQGQVREVHIYRLALTGTIEQTILQRQALKKRLNAVILDEEAESAAASDRAASSSDDLKTVFTNEESLKSPSCLEEILCPNKATCRQFLDGCVEYQSREDAVLDKVMEAHRKTRVNSSENIEIFRDL